MLRRKITPRDARYVLIVCDSGGENDVDLEHEVVDEFYSVPNDDQLQNKRLGQVCHTHKYLPHILHLNAIQSGKLLQSNTSYSLKYHSII